MKLSRQELLAETRLAERCDRLMTVETPASFAAWAKFTVAWMQAGRDRPDEVGGIDALHRRAHGVDLQEIAEHDFGAELLQRLRPGILAVHHRADVEAERDRFSDGGAAGVAGRA